MKFHACRFRCLLRGSDKALVVGIAGGRVNYLPESLWLYSLRFYLLIFTLEVLWRAGKPVPVSFQYDCPAADSIRFADPDYSPCPRCGSTKRQFRSGLGETLGPCPNTIYRCAKCHFPEEGPIHWNPGNKVVQDHRDGTIDHEATNRERAKRGLPVPWRPELAEAEARMPDIL